MRVMLAVFAQGEIEKTGELVDVDRPSPPKKRRRAKAEMPLEGELPRDPAAKTEVTKKKRAEGEGAAAAASEEAKGEPSKKKRLKGEGGAGVDGKADMGQTKRSKGEAAVGEVRKVKRVKKAEKAAVPSQPSLGLQATTDAPASAAPPQATKASLAGALCSDISVSMT